MTDKVEASMQAVVDWRRSELVRAGYSSQVADEIAQRGDIDLHDALALTARGCPSTLAWEILR
ncbi:MAG TPA: hypothetical protein VFU64_09475 [Gaiellaceae bacterium]|nr:hypothetical protein [Gaiellaceae bacterium]